MRSGSSFSCRFFRSQIQCQLLFGGWPGIPMVKSRPQITNDLCEDTNPMCLLQRYSRDTRGVLELARTAGGGSPNVAKYMIYICKSTVLRAHSKQFLTEFPPCEICKNVFHGRWFIMDQISENVPEVDRTISCRTSIHNDEIALRSVPQSLPHCYVGRGASAVVSIISMMSRRVPFEGN